MSLRPRSLVVALLALVVCALAFGQTVTTCDAACTVTQVISLNTPVLNLDEAGAAQIASAVLAVWGLAYGFRAVIRTLKGTDGDSSTSESE